MSGRTSSRRDVLRRLGGLAALLFGTGCKKEDRTFACTDPRALGPDDVQARAALAYVDDTGTPGKDCSTCQQYVPGPESGACGTCKIMKGPIHPKGYCKVFAPRG